MEQKKASFQELSTHQLQNNKNQLLYYIIGAIFALLVSIAIFFLFSKGRKREIIVTEPIPYIWNAQFQKELNSFVTQANHKDVLVIYGPSGVGKTRGLQIYQSYLQSRDCLTFDFDLKILSKFATIKDFVQFMNLQIITSLKSFDGKMKQNQDVLKSIKLVEALTSIEQPIKNINQITKDPLLQRLIQALFCITETMKNKPEIALRSLFESFDALEPLSPVVIVHNINHLLQMQDDSVKGIFDLFWRICDEFSNEYRSLPIIVEISDQAPILRQSMKETIRMFRVDEFSFEDAKKALVDTKLMKHADFQFAYDNFGCHGKSFAQFYDFLQEGFTSQAAYLKYMKQVKDQIIQCILIDGNKQMVNERISFLKQVADKKVIHVNRNPRIASHLMNWKIISLYNLTHVSYPNKLTEKITVSVLNKFKK